MRVLIIALLVACAAAACTQDTFLDACPSLDAGTYKVSQVGPSPGAKGIIGTQLTAGQADVRDGSQLANGFATFNPTDADSKYTAPYSGCYYFVESEPTGTVYMLRAGPICTNNAERTTNGALNPRVAKAPKLQPFDAVTGPTSLYQLKLTFLIDSAHAGVAFEFLNLKSTTPADDNTRCGVSFDNKIAVQNDKIPSPHGGGFYILNPGTVAANGIWALDRQFVNGFANVTYTIADFNNALKNCGWARDESKTGFTLFSAQVRATTVSQGQSIRGVLYKKYEETVVSISVSFNTKVDATSGTLNVNSPLVLFSEVTKQIFDPVTKRAYLMLFTSSQGPYQLNTASAKCTSPSGECNAWKNGAESIAPVTAFRPLLATDRSTLKLASGDVGYNGVSTSNAATAACFVDATSENTPNYTAADAAIWPPCNQFWFMEIQGSTDCGSITTGSGLVQNLTGTWTVYFDIGCDDTYKGSCRIQTPAGAPVAGNTSVTFSTSSDNYCPRIIDTVSSTAKLLVFQDRNRLIGQDQFVFGTTSYYSAEVTSSIKIQSVLTEEVAIIQGGAYDNTDFLLNLAGFTGGIYTRPSTDSPRQILYSNGFPEAVDASQNNAYFTAALENPDSSCSGRSGLNRVSSDPIDTTTAGPPDSAATGTVTTRCYASNNTVGQFPVRDWSISQFVAADSSAWSLTAKNYFQWYWNEATSSATGDFAQITSVRWLGRIRYADQSTAKVATWVAPHVGLSAFDASSATVTSTMTGGPTSSTSGSSAAVSTTTIAVAAAAVAAIAVMAIAAFVVLRSRNAKMETETNLESVTLGTMGSSAQLSA